MDDVFARPKAITFNLNGPVRFRVRPGFQSLFLDQPGVTLCGIANGDGTYTGKAQFHVLMKILDGQAFRGFNTPIETDLEFLIDGEESAPYGYCPHCGAPGTSRERRPDGNDRCPNGHVYPSRHARP